MGRGRNSRTSRWYRSRARRTYRSTLWQNFPPLAPSPNGETLALNRTLVRLCRSRLILVDAKRATPSGHRRFTHFRFLGTRGVFAFTRAHSRLVADGRPRASGVSRRVRRRTSCPHTSLRPLTRFSARTHLYTCGNAYLTTIDSPPAFTGNSRHLDGRNPDRSPTGRYARLWRIADDIVFSTFSVKNERLHVHIFNYFLIHIRVRAIENKQIRWFQILFL